jgi:hypothetical protein
MWNNYETPELAKQAAIDYVANCGPIEFDGMNCNDYPDDDHFECGGWDGESRRCECGNRRVSWDIEKTSDGRYYVVARAY